MRDNITGGALTETMFLVLLATYTPNHGYGIMQFIERETEGRVLLGAGSLYGAVNTLLKKGWIDPAGTEERGSSKKEYRITPLGKGIAEKELQRLNELWHMASKIIGGGSR